MAYNVSAAFREQCYSGESLYSCRLIIGENTIPISQIASITISSPIIDSNSETFYIGTFISQQLTIEFKNLDGIDTASGTNVELYISQNVGGTDIEVPIGKYVIDESPENYYQSAKIVCLDYAIKFATNLDYSSAFVDNKITIDNLLQWICNHYGITLGSYPSINGNVEIGTYDSTVSGKRWISYIAEIKGCNAKMDRLGQLTLVPIKSSPAVTIDALKSASWKLGEKFEISQVTFFDAIRNYTYGDDSENTLFLRQDNPFIIDTNVVQNVYNAVKDLQIWSLKCDNYGDISLDAWDIIQYTLGNETYYTYNNNTITYAMTIMSKVETKIPTKQQEVTTNVLGGDEQQQIRRLKTEVNTLDNEITIAAEQIETIEQDIQNPTSTKENKYFDLEDALDTPLIDFSLYGETQQDSTTGKNLLNANPTSIKYTANTQTTTSLGTIQLTGGTTYYYSYTIGNATTSNTRNTPFYRLSGESRIYESSNSNYNLSKGRKVWQITPSESGTYEFGYWCHTPNVDLTVQDFMVSTSSNSDYEPYTGGQPAPNPQFPMDIHNVSGDNTIEICGKNLYKPLSFSRTNNGVDFSHNLDGTITANNTATANAFSMNSSQAISNNCILNLKTGTYTISGGKSNVFVNLVDLNGANISSTNATNLSQTFTISEDTQCFLRIQVPNGTSVSNETIYPMLEKSSTATEYEAYQGNSQLISLGVKNYCSSVSKPANANLRFYFDKDIPKTITISFTSNETLSNNSLYLEVDGTSLGNVGRITGNANTRVSKTIELSDSNYQAIQNGTDISLLLYKNGANFEIPTDAQIEKGSKANSYSEYGKPYIELNKISTYQDYIYKSSDKWYIHKEIGKVVLDGSESWSYNSQYTFFYTTSFTPANTDVYTNYYRYYPTITGITGNYGCSVYQNNFRIKNTDYTVPSDFKTWLSTHNTSVYYVLENATDTEITDTTLLEQLNNLMTLPLYKNMTHITLTPNDLQPIMKIEYYRDTSINNNFVPKEDMTKYYTKTETNAQIKITGDSISSEVARVEQKTDENNEYTSRVETSVTNLQTDTRTLLTFKQNVEQNGVETLKNTLIQADINGLSITKGENFKNLMTDRNQKIESNGKEIMFMGYDDMQRRNVARIDDIESKRATIGVHRCETTGTGANQRTAWFYVGGGN